MSFTLLFPFPSVLSSVFRSLYSLFYLNLCQAYFMPFFIPCLKDSAKRLLCQVFHMIFCIPDCLTGYYA